MESSLCTGAFDYLYKPLSLDAIEAVVDKADRHLLKLPKEPLVRKSSSKSQKPGYKFIVHSPSMRRIMSDLENIAKSSASVCIHGESGTGKEVIAQLIHEQSPRSGRPFVKVNCAAVPDTLIESEFFGHEKGSFTGAAARRLGRFELAHMGSLLLDEITETPLIFRQSC